MDVTNIMTKNVQPVYENGKPILQEGRRSYMDRYPAYILVDEPYRIQDMTLEETELWLNHKDYKGNQFYRFTDNNNIKHKITLAPIREQITKRQKEIKLAKQEMEQFNNKEELIRQYVEELNAIANNVIKSRTRSTERAAEVNGSKNRNTIFDLPSVKLGLYSVKAYDIKLKDPSFSLTEEHCHPRTWAAMELFRSVVSHKKDDPTWELQVSDVIPYLFQYCMIVWTTKAENKKLEPYQKWFKFENVAASYTSAEIVVVDTGVGVQIPWQWNRLSERYNVDLSAISVPNFNDIITPDQLTLGSDVV